jgi:hypothetical protein
MLEARRAQALQRMKSEDRVRKTRQAILIGQYVLHRFPVSGDDREILQKIIEDTSKNLARPNDRELSAELLASPKA